MTTINTKTKVALPSTCSILGIMFICFKVFGVVDWAWWLVLLPFWGPVAGAVAILVIAFVIAGILELTDGDD